jgi:hypothetical protein
MVSLRRTIFIKDHEGSGHRACGCLQNKDLIPKTYETKKNTSTTHVAASSALLGATSIWQWKWRCGRWCGVLPDNTSRLASLLRHPVSRLYKASSPDTFSMMMLSLLISPCMTPISPRSTLSHRSSQSLRGASRWNRDSLSYIRFRTLVLITGYALICKYEYEPTYSVCSIVYLTVVHRY